MARGSDPQFISSEHCASTTCQFESLVDVVTGGLLYRVRLLWAEIEKCGLLSSMFAQFGHLVHAARNSLLLFSLIPALCFLALSLLPCVFLLALCEC
jgi:hypothetical protein